MIAEIQQASDVTFRIYDWNRLGTDGQPRPLHVQQALDVIDYQRGPINPQRPQPTDRRYVSRLAECDKFVLDRWEFDEPHRIGGDDRFHLISVLHGAIEVAGDPTLLLFFFFHIIPSTFFYFPFFPFFYSLFYSFFYYYTIGH